MKKNSLESYLKGDLLYGDDFSIEKIKEWFEDEKEGYSSLIQDEKYEYNYYESDKKYLFQYLPKELSNLRALGIGSAYGKEFETISSQLSDIVVIEPSEKFVQNSIGGVPSTYIKPAIDGTMSFDDESFDLILCFSSLHHIPNLTYVFQEISRCLKKDGYLFIREPIVSMREPIRSIEGFHQPRPGLSRRERGIPYSFFLKKFKENNLKIVNSQFSQMPLNRVFSFFSKKNINNSKTGLLFDKFLSDLFKWNQRYHATNLVGKLRPSCISFVLKK